MLTVDVTKADIQSGERENGKACPVARALNRALLNTFEGAGVYPGDMGLYPHVHRFDITLRRRPSLSPPDERVVWTWKLDSDIVAITRLFDETGWMDPFSFELEWPTVLDKDAKRDLTAHGVIWE